MRKPAKESAQILKIGAGMDAIMPASTATLPPHMSSQSATACAVTALLLCSGCSGAPSVAILGAYFPGWMLCALLGIALTALIRLLAAASGIWREASPPLLYPLLALLFGTLTWIFLFRGLS
jgi:hypothetical protein